MAEEPGVGGGVGVGAGEGVSINERNDFSALQFTDNSVHDCVLHGL